MTFEMHDSKVLAGTSLLYSTEAFISICAHITPPAKQSFLNTKKNSAGLIKKGALAFHAPF